jgi:hypothetical protein
MKCKTNQADTVFADTGSQMKRHSCACDVAFLFSCKEWLDGSSAMLYKTEFVGTNFITFRMPSRGWYLRVGFHFVLVVLCYFE